MAITSMKITRIDEKGHWSARTGMPAYHGRRDGSTFSQGRLGESKFIRISCVQSSCGCADKARRDTRARKNRIADFMSSNNSERPLAQRGDEVYGHARVQSPIASREQAWSPEL